MAATLRSELRVIGAKNVETKHKGRIFVRCYLSSENNTRVHLNTQEIIQSSKKNDYLFWDDTFSLDCNGTADSINNIKKHGNIMFELRWRKDNSFLGKISGSHLLASAEIPWKNVFDAPNMEVQRWVPLTANPAAVFGVLKLEEGVKQPALQVAIKVEPEVPVSSTASMEEMKRMRRRRRRRERMTQCDECSSCCSCADNELLFVAAAFEAF